MEIPAWIGAGHSWPVQIRRIRKYSYIWDGGNIHNQHRSDVNDKTMSVWWNDNLEIYCHMDDIFIVESRDDLIVVMNNCQR